MRQARSRCRPIGMTAKTVATSGTPPIAPEPWDISLKSPSKINLFLRILGKRKDGYHEIASLFQAISLHDNLSVSLLPPSVMTDKLECAAPGVPTDGTNLVLQAFENFRQATGSTRHFRARLEKRVPHAAGLGGGSANAATALWAANKLTGEKCSDKDLAEIGARFGSDISFFFTNGSAYCTGKGDKMMEIDRLNPNVLYIVKPAESLSTRDVFNALDVEKCKQGKNPRDLLETMKKGVIFADFVNDLEEPSFRLVPRLKEIKAALYGAGFNVSATAIVFFFHCLLTCWSGCDDDREWDFVLLPRTPEGSRILFRRVSL